MERGLGERSTLGYSIEIARNLLSMRMAKPEVEKATGLSIEEVDRLALSYVECWISSPAVAGVHSPAPYFSHLPKADVSSHSPFMKRGIGREVTTPMASADQMDWILGDNVTIVDMGNGGC